MYTTVDKNECRHVTNDLEKSESAVSEYAEVDQLKINEVQKYTDITLKSESDDSGLPAAMPTKCRVRYALEAAAFLVGVAFLAMLIFLFLKVFSLESPFALSNENMSCNTNQCTEQLEAVQKRIDSLNVSNILISYIYSSDIFRVLDTPAYFHHVQPF